MKFSAPAQSHAHAEEEDEELPETGEKYAECGEIKPTQLCMKRHEKGGE